MWIQHQMSAKHFEKRLKIPMANVQPVGNTIK